MEKVEWLTDSQLELFYAIRDFIDENLYSPTVRELADLTCKSSPATTLASLKILKRKGYIDYKHKKMRTIKIIKDYEGL